MLIVILGDLANGIEELIGPFDDETAAEQYMAVAFPDEHYVTAYVKEP